MQSVAPAAFLSRLRVYLDERFPPLTHSLLIVPFFASSYLLAAHLSAPQPTTIGWRAMAGLITVWLTFLLLRVLDEFKDADHDRRCHPERPVPRGLIALTELRQIGILAALVSITASALASPEALLSCLVVLGFAWLMGKEFFVAEWLKRDIFVYALTHQGIVPLLCLYAWTLGAGPSLVWDARFLLHVGGCVGTGLGFEMARKMRGPADEVPGEDSYTRRFGTVGAAVICSLLLLASAGFGLALGSKLAFPIWYDVLIGLSGAAVLAATVNFARRPDARSSKVYGLLASIAMLLYYLAVTAALIAVAGLRIG